MQVGYRVIHQPPLVSIAYHVHQFRPGLRDELQIPFADFNSTTRVDVVFRIKKLDPGDSTQEWIFQIHLLNGLWQRQVTHTHFPTRFSQLQLGKRFLKLLGWFGGNSAVLALLINCT